MNTEDTTRALLVLLIEVTQLEETAVRLREQIAAFAKQYGVEAA